MGKRLRRNPCLLDDFSLLLVCGNGLAHLFFGESRGFHWMDGWITLEGFSSLDIMQVGLSSYLVLVNVYV